MPSGKLKWYDSVKGFGFIVPDDANQKDVFVHASALNDAGINPREMVENAALNYELKESRGRTVASNLKIVK